MRPFYNIGIDKLTLCYTIEENSILHDINNEDQEIDMGDFKLKRIESGHFKNSFLILSLWDAPDGNGLTWQVYGTLKFNRFTDKDEKCKLAWLYFDNHTLYKQVYPNVSSIIYGEYISVLLGLELHNITEIEIYIDTSSNAPRTIKKMIRNNSIETIFNGNVLERKEKQPKLGYYHTGNLNRYTDLTIYIKQQDKEGFMMKAYDKLTEIQEDSHKNYILTWHRRNTNQPLFRVELSLKHRHLKDYINSNSIELSHNLFTVKEFLFNCFLHFADRLIRFREQNGKVHSALEFI
ncbi:hypothetical protein H8784_05345 [Parabacteroides acidifaciens]|uniref:Uncharacterized protein n=1 Tax=Parabacteroides acidifaciens TaxID=2290935 RepID=A0A3D8HHZ3_9BACT|nr:hypothetical protein [Parabacteroides acidifaciens]MBC8601145.1 hypothetical protein [Parabacteroides acidifaciens]RDU50207.1 hypothetical protein DWU89_05465 [Parabacteroides acidifaciens]